MDIVRTYEQELRYIERVAPCQYRIAKGFVPNMNVEGTFYVNDELQELLFSELGQYCKATAQQGFLPALKQIANVAGLPGIVGRSIALPDVHSGYGFAIGNVAAFDMADPQAVVSPGGVGFDINCGVRLLRTTLSESDVAPVKEQLAQNLFDHIPVGVGSQGVIPTASSDVTPTRVERDGPFWRGPSRQMSAYPHPLSRSCKRRSNMAWIGQCEKDTLGLKTR